MAIHLFPFRNLFWLPDNPDPELRAWVAGLGIRDPQPDSRADQEEWTEAACQAKAIIGTGYEVMLHLAVPNRFGMMTETDADLVRIPGNRCPDILIRHGGDGPEGVREQPDAELSARYAELAAFETLSGRKTVLADSIIRPDPDSMMEYTGAMSRSRGGLSISEALTSFRGSSCLVKVTRPVKYTHNRQIDIPADADADRLAQIAIRAFEYDLMRIEGDRDNILIQEKIPMTHETRFFVARGRVVSGAACIEEHTPLDREPGTDILAPVFEIRRNGGQRVRDEDVAKRLVAFAERAAEMIVAEEPELRNFVLDAAIGPDGKPVMIELNPLVGSGLYANDPKAIAEAFVEDMIRRAELEAETPEP